MKKKCLFIILWILFQTASGQVDTLTYLGQMEDEIDNLSTLIENAEEYGEELLEEWEAADTSCNLNALSYEAAVRWLKFTDYQYYQLQLYIEETGPLVSIYELAAIPGFCQEDITRLSPFVKVEKIPEKGSFWRDLLKRSRSSLLLRDSWVLERQAGYDTTRSSHYQGSRDHLCFRYAFESQGKLFLKISGEKDAGEQFFRGQQRYGFDFYSGSIFLKNMGLVRQAVIGDYRLNYGQGLVIGSSLLSGKGGEIAQLRRFSTGIRAVAPSNEGDFLRGGAITIGNIKMQGTVFAGQSFGTPYGITGANVAYAHRHFRVGGRVVCQLEYDTARPRPPSQHPFAFRSLCAGIDYQATLRQALLYGEVAVTHQGHPAFLQGLTLPLSAVTHLAVMLRHYSIGYSSPLGRAFGANNNNSGESGLYLCLQHILNRKMEIRTYFDYYLLHTPTYRLDAPTPALDAGTYLLLTLSRHNQLTLSYQFRNKPANCDDQHYKRLQDIHSHRLRLLWQYQPLPHLTCKSGILWKLSAYPYISQHYQGLLLYQDFAYQCWKDRVSVHARIAFFHTDRYDERLYAYEDDVYYAFTIGSYYYTGMRTYGVVRFQYKFVSLWIRIGHTFYTDRQSISSGLTQIDKPHKTELRVQILWKW